MNKLQINARYSAVRQLAPQVPLSDDISVAITAVPEGRLTHASLLGSVGTGNVRGFLRADVQAKLASAWSRPTGSMCGS